MPKFRRINSQGDVWCYKCRQWLAPSSFPNDVARAIGLGSKCRDCQNAYYKKEYYPQNRDSLIERSKEWKRK